MKTLIRETVGVKYLTINYYKRYGFFRGRGGGGGGSATVTKWKRGEGCLIIISYLPEHICEIITCQYFSSVPQSLCYYLLQESKRIPQLVTVFARLNLFSHYGNKLTVPVTQKRVL